MTTTSTSLRDIVIENYNNASVLEKYGLDFCCKGGISLKEACGVKRLDLEKIVRELSEVGYDDSSQRFFRWELPFLIDYIVNNHHAYVKYQISLIDLHLEKVIHEHGDKYPEMREVNAIFRIYSKELGHHMNKEEKILFPFIKELAMSFAKGEDPSKVHFGSVGAPIAIMREEHAYVGKELAHIRNLLGNYVPPDDACATMRLVYKELEAFGQDLHKHVFLENTILFPKAISLENKLRQPEIYSMN